MLKLPTKAELAAVKTYNTKQKAKLEAHRTFCRTHRSAATCARPFKAPLKKAPKPAPLFPAGAVRTIGGVKVGFIGETLEGTPRIVTPTGVEGLKFLDEAYVANSYANLLHKQGVNTVVLLLHEGG